MVARRSQQFTSQEWNGLWGTDARYYARRSDGACFAIDGAMTVFDLAGSSPPSLHAQPVAALPHVGRYTLRVFAARPIANGKPDTPDDAAATVAPRRSARLFAYGVRRPVSR